MVAVLRATIVALIMAVSATGGCLATLGLNDAPTAQMNIEPSGTVREGDTVTFSAAGSSDPDGDSLTFTWSFGEGNVGPGLTTSHAYR